MIKIHIVLLRSAQDFLKENPEKQRDPEDLAQADKENIFDKDPVSQCLVLLHNESAVFCAPTF